MYEGTLLQRQDIVLVSVELYEVTDCPFHHLSVMTFKNAQRKEKCTVHDHDEQKKRSWPKLQQGRSRLDVRDASQVKLVSSKDLGIPIIKSCFKWGRQTSGWKNVGLDATWDKGIQ